jgi:hypothetical protein
MTKQEKQKLIVLYMATASFMGSCFLSHDPFLGLLSIGFILGFMANDTFFSNNEERR